MGALRIVHNLAVLTVRNPQNATKVALSLVGLYEFSEGLFAFALHDNIDFGILLKTLLCGCGEVLATRNSQGIGGDAFGGFKRLNYRISVAGCKRRTSDHVRFEGGYALLEGFPIDFLAVTIKYSDFYASNMFFQVGSELNDTVGWRQVFAHDKPYVFGGLNKENSHTCNLVGELAV